MKWKEWLDQWSMRGLKVNAGFLEMEWEPKDRDRDAAWELYVELLTRISTQHLQPEHGDEKTSLDSIHALFGLTRETLKSQGRHCDEFAKTAIVVLNQVVRPFTAKWHRASLAGAFKDETRCQEFRDELSALQQQLRLLRSSGEFPVRNTRKRLRRTGNCGSACEYQVHSYALLCTSARRCYPNGIFVPILGHLISSLRHGSRFESGKPLMPFPW